MSGATSAKTEAVLFSGADNFEIRQKARQGRRKRWENLNEGIIGGGPVLIARAQGQDDGAGVSC
jgi:hypothetical protein